MDGAWALYEAWVKLQLGEVDTALVYGYGKSSPGDLPDGADPPARPVLRRAAVARLGQPGRPAGPGAARRRQGHRGARWPRSPPAAARRRSDNPQRPARRGTGPSTSCSPRSRLVAPLRKHDCPPITDGAAAVVLAAGDVARERCERPAWIRGIDHRIEPHGPRRSATSPSRASTRHRRREGRRRRRPGRRGRAARAVHPPGADPARRRSGSATTSTSTRRAARWPPTR